jgi:hypothetical protein
MAHEMGRNKRGATGAKKAPAWLIAWQNGQSIEPFSSGVFPDAGAFAT